MISVPLAEAEERKVPQSLVQSTHFCTHILWTVFVLSQDAATITTDQQPPFTVTTVLDCWSELNPKA